MCGRYTLTTSAAELAKYFRLDGMPQWIPRYNIAPSQRVPVVVTAKEHGRSTWRTMIWGLVPSWAKDPGIGARLINARCGTVMDKPAFRAAVHCRRCVIPADGFYEWKRTATGKQPYHIALRNHGPFGFAGLWEPWQGADGTEVETCTILTTTANQVVSPIYARMPVMLPSDEYARWMDPTMEHPGKIMSLLRPFPEADMTSTRVGRSVNHVANDSPACMEGDPQAEMF